MAKLLETEYPFPKHSDYPVNGYNKQYFIDADKAFDEIPEDKVISFSVADGLANYYIVSLEPLVLQLIPYMDAYEIPYAHIRGLRKEDVLRHIEYKKRLNKLFK